MCEDEGFLTSDDIRRGYIKPHGRAWKEVRYANVGGLAVFEGCIILGKTEEVEASMQEIDHAVLAMPELLTMPDIAFEGIGITGSQYRWENRTVPFFISADIPNSQRITEAIAHWHAKSSIRFVTRTSQPDYVNFVRTNDGCASLVGRQGGAQPLVLRDSCTTGNIIHELGHAVGLWHEQSREDRDQFVEIIRSNITPGKEFNFEQRVSNGDDLGAYDFGSIMHYPATAFSVTQAPTIRPRLPLPTGVVMGQRTSLSAGDIAAIEALYHGIPSAVS